MHFDANVFTDCLRCGAKLGDDQSAPCPACGADPVVERQVYAQLQPAIKELRFIFLAVMIVEGLAAWLVYGKLKQAGLDTTPVLLRSAPICSGMAMLWLLAPRAPLFTASIGGALFAAEWLLEIADDARVALEPSIMLLLHLLIMISLGFAIRAGLNVRRLRAQQGPPRAVARVAKS